MSSDGGSSPSMDFASHYLLTLPLIIAEVGGSRAGAAGTLTLHVRQARAGAIHSAWGLGPAHTVSLGPVAVAPRRSHYCHRCCCFRFWTSAAEVGKQFQPLHPLLRVEGQPGGGDRAESWQWSLSAAPVSAPVQAGPEAWAKHTALTLATPCRRLLCLQSSHWTYLPLP